MKGWGINNRVLYRRAMSIQHRMERIEKTERPTKEKTLRARFGEKEFHGDEVLTVKNLSKQFGGRTLFSGVELTVRGGERIALLGDNGTGKTTFLRVLLGELPAEGKIKFGPSVKSGYLPQVIHFAHPERTLYDTMLYEKNCTPQTARDRLGAFLFSGEDVFKTVGTLSSAASSRGCGCACSWMKRSICSCSTSRRTIWTSPRANGSNAPPRVLRGHADLRLARPLFRR